MEQRFHVDDRLSEVRDRSLGCVLPIPLHERIDELCARVFDAGYARPSKGKMLAALVLGAPTEADELDTLLRAYDRARVGDALVTSKPEGAVVAFPKRRSGPRPR